MKTVLLWGNAWWIGGERALLRTEGAPVEALARHFGETRPELRLIYQPDSQVVAHAACPNSGRTVLASALQSQLPELSDPACAWSYEPIYQRGEGFETLFHIEREVGALATLIHALERVGFSIESVWPLGSFLQFVPTEWTATGAMTVIAVQMERVCAYRHAADGRREICVWHGADALTELHRWIRPNVIADEPLLVLVLDDVVTDLIDQMLGLSAREHATARYLSDALEGPVVLPRRHPAQLLSPRSFFSTQFAVIVSIVALLAVGAWWTADYARTCATWRTAGAAREKQKRLVRAEVEHLRANAEDLVRLQSGLAQPRPARACDALVAKIVATVPDRAALQALRIEGARFRAQGFIAPGVDEHALETWHTQLADPRWSVQPGAKPSSDGAFVVVGEFKA